MLSILYILHHCTTLQKLGGNFPHRALGKVGSALTCREEKACRAGCSTKQQDLSFPSLLFFPSALSPKQQELRMGSVLGSEHVGETLRLSLSRTTPQAEPSSGRSVLGGGHCANRIQPKTLFRLSQDRISLAQCLFYTLLLISLEKRQLKPFALQQDGKDERRREQNNQLKKKNPLSRKSHSDLMSALH